VSQDDLQNSIDTRLKPYRNLLHDEFLAKPKDLKGKRLIPRAAAVDKYRSWTKVMYEIDPSDFILAEEQIKGDFRALCSKLEAVWKNMCTASEAFWSLPSYQQLLAKGQDDSILANGRGPVFGSFILGSDAQFIVRPAHRSKRVSG